MFWWCVALPICVIMVVVGVILLFKFNFEFTGGCLVAFGGFFVLLICIICPLLMRFGKRDIAQFEQQKAYIEQRQQSDIDEIENAALTNKKIELNAELYNWQYSYKNYRFFTLLPGRVMDLTPIE